MFNKFILHENKESDVNFWFTSDTHAYHLNICKGTTKWSSDRAKNSVRNFDTIDKMNETIINNINYVVKENDILFHLGDWSFDGFDKIQKFRNRLLCKNIYLITGNHDHHQISNKDNIRSIYKDVYEYYREIEVVHYVQKYQRMEKTKLVLCHFPLCSWNEMSKGVIHLHGHVHLKANHKLGQGRSLDVGVDGNNYKPYNFKEILSIMENQPIASLCLPNDHHVNEKI